MSPDDYRAYMLRLWRGDSASPWRAQLENPSTGELHSFSSLEALMFFLRVSREKKTPGERTPPGDTPAP